MPPIVRSTAKTKAETPPVPPLPNSSTREGKDEGDFRILEAAIEDSDDDDDIRALAKDPVMKKLQSYTNQRSSGSSSRKLTVNRPGRNAREEHCRKNEEVDQMMLNFDSMLQEYLTRKSYIFLLSSLLTNR